MIGHGFDRFHHSLVLRPHLIEQFSQAFLNFPDRNRPTIFLTPNEVRLKGENHPRVRENYGYVVCYTVRNLISRGATAIPLPAKAGSPLAA